jgi:hypothetical protein
LQNLEREAAQLTRFICDPAPLKSGRRSS